MSIANSMNFKPGDIVWVVNPQGVPLRERPDLNASTLDTARFGARLRVIEVPRVQRDTEWLHVSTDDGREYWIVSGSADIPFVSTVRPEDAYDVIVRDEPVGSLPRDGLAVRSDQNLKAPVIDRVRAGERLTVFVADYQATGGTWYGVETPRKQIGWILDQTGRWLQRPKLNVSPGDSTHNENANFEQISFAPVTQTTYPGTATGPGDSPADDYPSAQSNTLTGPGDTVADSAADYRFQLEVTNWPQKVTPGEVVALNIVLQNRGEQRWVTGLDSPISGQPVEMTYRIVRSRGGVAARERLPLDDSVESGSETTLTRTITAPEDPGDYLVFWDMEHRLTGEAFSEHADGAPKPLSLQVLDLPRVRDALDDDLPEDASERSALIATMGELLLRPIDVALQQKILDVGLIPAVFDAASARVAKAALYGLYEARRRDTTIEPKLKAAFETRADEVAMLRDWLEGGRLRKAVLNWVHALLPSAEEAKSDEKTVGSEKPIEQLKTAKHTSLEKVDQPGSSSRGQIKQPPVQIIVTPPSKYYARPPAERKVTVHVAKDSVTLKHGADAYASPNRLNHQEIDRAEHISPEKYGRLLFDGLFNDEEWPPFQGSTRVGFDKHLHGAENLIFELSIAPDQPGLSLLRWEYLIAPNSAQPLAVFKQSPFFRLMGGQSPQSPPSWPLKVLVVICNPSTLGLPVDAQGFPVDAQGRQANRNIAGLKVLDVEQERAIVTDALEQVKHFGAVEYDVLIGTPGRRVTLAALHQALHDRAYHILHVIAHGVTVLDEFHLVMEDDEGREELVSIDKFDQPRFGGLRLAVLDTCQSATHVVKGALHGLAPHLIKIGVPAVVAMQAVVPIPTAQRFTQWFYHHLARSGRIDMALAATRLQLYDVDRSSWNWGIPVLIMSSDDGQLFDVSDGLVEQQQMPDTIEVKERRFAETPADDQALRSYLASQAAQLGASPALVGAYSRWSSQPPSLPLIEPQDRRALTGTIEQPVDIKADKLEEFVNPEGGGGLRLDTAAFERIASALNAGKHIILIGPPGTGKTTLAQRICQYATDRQRCAAGHVLTTATADWTTFDTVGGYVPTQQQTLEFRPGAFLRAIREGRWLIIDEINRAEIDKAFGELFTLLSGQGVDLPYTVRGQPVRLRPPKSAETLDWAPDDLKDYDYVVHPTWRIIGTMNVYDKSYLFAMSFAFMRRFAFIDCDLPGKLDELDQNHLPRDLFAELIRDWLKREQLETLDLEKKLIDLINRDTALMKRRALGPAIIRDMLFFVKDRHKHNPAAGALSLLGEAILLYAVPQLDGLDRADILDIYKYLNGFLMSQTGDDALTKVRASVLSRLAQLYPHIRSEEWAKARQ